MAEQGAAYRLAVVGAGGAHLLRRDPWARSAEATSCWCFVHSPAAYEWQHTDWQPYSYDKVHTCCWLAAWWWMPLWWWERPRQFAGMGEDGSGRDLPRLQGWVKVGGEEASSEQGLGANEQEPDYHASFIYAAACLPHLTLQPIACSLSSTRCMWGPSPQRAPCAPPSSGCPTSRPWGSQCWSSCPARSTPTRGHGATTLASCWRWTGASAHQRWEGWGLGAWVQWWRREGPGCYISAHWSTRQRAHPPSWCLGT